LAFIFIPANTLNFVGIPREKNNQISAINSFMRNIGGSLGIAVITNYLTRSAQKHQTFLVEHATPGSPAYDNMMNGLTATLERAGVGKSEAQHQSMGRIYALVQQHATSLAYVDAVAVLAVVIAALTPLVLILKRPRHAPEGASSLH
jgi:DHA2 family multidrug resistance protein